MTRNDTLALIRDIVIILVGIVWLLSRLIGAID